MTDEEKAAMDAINAAHRAVLTLDGGLLANHSELTAAVHVLQGFVAQHVLRRLDPDAWGAWYEGQKTR